MITMQSGCHPQQEQDSASHRQCSWMKCSWVTQPYGYVWPRKRLIREHMKSSNKLLVVSSDHRLDNTTRFSVLCSFSALHKCREWMVFSLVLCISSISPYTVCLFRFRTQKKKERKGMITWDKIKKWLFNDCFIFRTLFWLF